MAHYTNVPNELVDDLAEGKINAKMFLVLVWLLRRADYSTGVAIKVSAPRIRAEMWGDDLEDGIPSERTIQEILKRLDRAGYIKSHHIKGRKASYPVSLNNFTAVVKGQDGKTTNAMLRSVDTTFWRDLPEFGCGDCNGDTAMILRGDCGDCDSDSNGDCDSDASAYTSYSLDSSPSTDTTASPASPARPDVRRRTSGGQSAKSESSEDAGMEQEIPSVPSLAKASVSNPVSVPDDDAKSDSERQEHENAVSLCSLWWSTHSENNSDISLETSPASETHKWGHPRTWTPAQRREAFIRANAGDDENSLRLIVPNPAPEDDPEPTIDFDAAAEKEEVQLRDEGVMLKLIEQRGYDQLEDLLRWLPKSNNWYASGRLHSLAQLLDSRTWDFITADMQRYYAKALENNSEESCDEYVERIFLAAGGMLLTPFVGSGSCPLSTRRTRLRRWPWTPMTMCTVPPSLMYGRSTTSAMLQPPRTRRSPAMPSSIRGRMKMTTVRRHCMQRSQLRQMTRLSGSPPTARTVARCMPGRVHSAMASTRSAYEDSNQGQPDCGGQGGRIMRIPGGIGRGWMECQCVTEVRVG